MRLAGKVAIITGAASGIGRATALRFAQEGARVIVADINQAGGQATVEQIESQGGQAAFIETDVALETDLARMIEFTVATHGRLDILHNNAYWTEARTAAETSPENWQRTLDVSLRPTWLAAKLALPHLRSSGGGVILNTASVHSIVGLPGYAAYQAAKGGMLSLTRALALELAPEIRVVAILPGAIEAPAIGMGDQDFIKKLVATIPLKRMGRVEEIANLALFLASDEASYITGTGMIIDGGYTAQ